MPMRFRILHYEIVLFIRRHKERAWMFVARHMPREARRWVLVQLAVAAMGHDKGPEYATYETMSNVIDR